jgi:hypothetical protein
MRKVASSSLKHTLDVFHRATEFTLKGISDDLSV